MSDGGENGPAVAHLLLVEDSPAHAELVRMAIEESGFDGVLTHVTDGRAALDYLERAGAYADAPRPDLVLLDLNLPKVSGHEVLERVKGDAGLRSIPVVVLSTSDAPGDRERAYLGHANSYLVKRMPYGDLQAMLSDVVRYWTRWNRGVERAA